MELCIDTHAHLYHKNFAPDEAAMMARAQAVLSHVLLPGIDSESIGPLKALAGRYPGFCLPMAGLHPCSVQEGYAQELKLAEAELATGAYVGVGEAGIDLYWDKTTLPLQQQALRTQLDWAKQLGLPIVLHSREAFDETIALVEEAQDGRLRGVFHCFTDGLAQAQRATAAGFMLGIGGVFTYKNNGGLDAVIKTLGLQHVVLETDAPYLTPMPHRGKRNESSYIQLVCQKMAEVFEMPYDEVARTTSANARRMFGIKS
jgi:TatD DNase family protein